MPIRRQTEDNLTEAESALDRQTGTVENMTKRVSPHGPPRVPQPHNLSFPPSTLQIDELNTQVKENAKLRDQLDE